MSILERILERKRSELAKLEEKVGRASLRRAAEQAPPCRGFASALRTHSTPRVIAEFKRASPSKGIIREAADPARIARAYAQAGAAALSILTDRDFFQGSLDDLRAAREACTLPALRKDFIIDSLQIFEARAAGADAILLIVAALEDSALAELHACARTLGLDVLVEVHTREEIERARKLGAEILGINNRDLGSFRTDVAVTRSLLPDTQGCTVVSESGLDDADIIAELSESGVHAFLIGEALMRAEDPGEALETLRRNP